MHDNVLLSRNGQSKGSHSPRWFEWPALSGGWRHSHASVVIDHPETAEQTVVVIGGEKKYQRTTGSVILLNVNGGVRDWREGPNLNWNRSCHAAVTCNGRVYALGGKTSQSYMLDSIERIDVIDLLRTTSTSLIKCGQWTTLSCRLTTTRSGCAAVAVESRYIVVVGGSNNTRYDPLSSVDIIDTRVKPQHTVVAGAEMNIPRIRCAISVMDHRICVVGGSPTRRSVEYLTFHPYYFSVSGAFSSSWTKRNDLEVGLPDSSYNAVSVGSYIVLAGGCKNNLTNTPVSVHVVDMQRNTVWKLLDATTARKGCSLVAFSSGIAVIGGEGTVSCEMFPLIYEEKKHFKMIGSSTSLPASKSISDENRNLYDHQRHHRHCSLVTLESTFYTKLVKADSKHLALSVLARSVSNLCEMKIFYTVVHHMYRSQQISRQEWQRNSIKALRRTMSLIDVGDSEANWATWKRIVNKCRQDGIVVNDEIMNHHRRATASVGRLASHHQGVSQLELANYEFRVGEILLRTESEGIGKLSTSNTITSDGHRRCLSYVQILGRSLKEFHSAFYQQHHDHVAISFIFSILNAMAFVNVVPPPASKVWSGDSVLHQIVDYGDLDHICSVVGRSGNEMLQIACQSGLALVERATTNMFKTTNQRVVVSKKKLHHCNHETTDHDDFGRRFLVTILGPLANTVHQWVRNGEKDAGAAATILAMIATAKLTQASEPHVSPEALSIVDRPSHLDSSDGSSLGSRAINRMQKRIKALEDSVASLATDLKKESSTIACLLEELEKERLSKASMMQKVKTEQWKVFRLRRSMGFLILLIFGLAALLIVENCMFHNLDSGRSTVVTVRSTVVTAESF